MYNCVCQVSLESNVTPRYVTELALGKTVPLSVEGWMCGTRFPEMSCVDTESSETRCQTQLPCEIVLQALMVVCKPPYQKFLMIHFVKCLGKT